MQPSIKPRNTRYSGMLPTPTGLQLACGTSNTVSVDVLMGADPFFTGGIIKGDPTGPVALETK